VHSQFFWECATPPHVHPLSRYIIACDHFYQAFPRVSTVSYKHWGGYEASNTLIYCRTTEFTLRFVRREVKKLSKLLLKWRVMHLTMLCHKKRRRSLTLLDYVHAREGAQNSVVGWDVLSCTPSVPGLGREEIC